MTPEAMEKMYEECMAGGDGKPHTIWVSCPECNRSYVFNDQVGIRPQDVCDHVKELFCTQ